MSFKRSDVQIYFENMFTGSSGVPFQQIPMAQHEQTFLTREQAEDIANLLQDEVASYYYKALLSYMESIPAIKDKLFSWATVRLYYSVFYSIKTYLACRNIALVRRQKKLFYVKAKENECFKKCQDGTDHKGAIEVLKRLFKSDDALLTNTIEGIGAYEWMMRKREEVNYKDLNFHDPEAPSFWSMIDKEVMKGNVGQVIEKLVDDEWLYCFQEEYSILGLPTKRLLLTAREIKRSGKNVVIEDNKINLLSALSKDLPEHIVEHFTVW